MKKTLLFLFLLFVVVIGAHAQDDTRPKFGVGVTVGIATGRVFDQYPVSSGLVLKFEYPLGESGVSLLATSGFTYFVSKDGYSTGYNSSYGSYEYGSIAAFVPVQAGIKAYVAGRFFLQGEVGASFNVNANSTNFTEKKTALLLSPSVGYTIPFGRSRWSLDAGMGYEDRSDVGPAYNQVKVKAVFNVGL